MVEMEVREDEEYRKVKMRRKTMHPELHRGFGLGNRKETGKVEEVSPEQLV